MKDVINTPHKPMTIIVISSPAFAPPIYSRVMWHAATWEVDDGEHGQMVELHIGTMDITNDFAPECRIHHGEKPELLETAEVLPPYRVWYDVGEEPYISGPASSSASDFYTMGDKIR